MQSDIAVQEALNKQHVLGHRPLSQEGPCKVLHGLQSVGVEWLLELGVLMGIRSEEATSEANGPYTCICLNFLIGIHERQWFFILHHGQL